MLKSSTLIGPVSGAALNNALIALLMWYACGMQRPSLSLAFFIAIDHITGDGAFNYENFFGKKIQEKIDTNTYRKFRVVNRSVETFPGVKVVDDPSQADTMARDVTVWCSNDYLGMGQHQAVREAAM